MRLPLLLQRADGFGGVRHGALQRAAVAREVSAPRSRAQVGLVHEASGDGGSKTKQRPIAWRRSSALFLELRRELLVVRAERPPREVRRNQTQQRIVPGQRFRKIAVLF